MIYGTKLQNHDTGVLFVTELRFVSAQQGLGESRASFHTPQLETHEKVVERSDLNHRHFQHWLTVTCTIIKCHDGCKYP